MLKLYDVARKKTVLAFILSVLVASCEGGDPYTVRRQQMVVVILRKFIKNNSKIPPLLYGQTFVFILGIH